MKMSSENLKEAKKRALELAGFSAGSRILDIGCGEGDDVARLNEELGMKAEGIDMSLKAVERAREKHPGIDVKLGDGEFLDDYSSFTFDGVLMQDVLALINIPDEALHEAYCVLKKGGKLVIVDRYYRNPDRKKMKAVKIEAARQSVMPRKEGDCEANPTRFVDFRFDGIFYKEPLIAQLEETGYRVLAFEDVGQDGGDGNEETGIFLLTAAKPL